MMNKIALVTGASRGIGKQIAVHLAKQNIQVVANYNTSKSEAQKLAQLYSNIDIIQADVSQRNSVKKMVEYTIKKYGKIDILINNAGISKIKLFTDCTDEDWNKIISTNLYSVFCTTQEVLPNMIHNKSGCIINISSIWGIVGASCETLYSVSKAGVDAITKSLAKELGPSNIRVNSIAPGIINTEMNNFIQQELSNITDEIPLQKIGSTEDIAKCVDWLIEDNYTTGQVISINGGWSIT